MILSIFEESKGELRCFGYLPQYSIFVNCLVNASLLLACLVNFDKGAHVRVNKLRCCLAYVSNH